jgi:TonB family protein
MFCRRGTGFVLAVLAACFLFSEVTSGQTPEPRGSLEILSDTQGVDFGPYLTDVLNRVRTNWYARIPSGAAAKIGNLAVKFAIQKDGKITDLKQVASSGDAALDDAASTAIIASSPLPSLPAQFTGQALDLRIRFYDNPDMPAPLLTARAAGKQASAAASTSDSTDSVLCVPERAQTSVDHAKILSDTHSADLQPYLDGSVIPLLRANWYRLVSNAREKIGAQATVQFSILKDGSVSSVQLVEGAAHALLGDLAVDAVTKAAPFPPARSHDFRLARSARPLRQPKAAWTA